MLKSDADVDRVDERLVRDAGRAHLVGVLRGQARRGRSVSFSRKPSVARSCGSTGAVRQSRFTRLPDLVTERIRRDRGVGVRSERALLEVRDAAGEELALRRAPVGRAAHRDVERVRERSGRRSPAGSRASSGRRSARCRAARGSGRGLRGSPARGRSRRRRASEACEALFESVQPGSDRRGDGLLEDLVVGVAGVLQRLDVGVGDLVGGIAHLVEIGRRTPAAQGGPAARPRGDRRSAARSVTPEA